MKRLKKKKSAKAQLLKQGLADARKGRIAKAKEDYTKYANDKPLIETNPYLRDPTCAVPDQLGQPKTRRTSDTSIPAYFAFHL